uniref:Uncharacterized protein n=1 Tax=Glossina pallidipes TaxID=7398 RepID=A0A1A9ZXB7_GLOPL
MHYLQHTYAIRLVKAAAVGYWEYSLEKIKNEIKTKNNREEESKKRILELNETIYNRIYQIFVTNKDRLNNVRNLIRNHDIRKIMMTTTMMVMITMCLPNMFTCADNA